MIKDLMLIAHLTPSNTFSYVANTPPNSFAHVHTLIIMPATFPMIIRPVTFPRGMSNT